MSVQTNSRSVVSMMKEFVIFFFFFFTENRPTFIQMAFSFKESLVVIHVTFDTLWNESNMIFLHMSSKSSPFINTGHTHFNLVPPSATPQR